MGNITQLRNGSYFLARVSACSIGKVQYGLDVANGMSIAAAARTLSTERVNSIAQALTEGDISDAVEALRRGMRARRRVRAGMVPGMGMQYDDEEDFKTQVLTAKIVLDYRFGKAVQRGELSVIDETDSRRDRSRAEIVKELAQDMAPVLDILRTYAPKQDPKPIDLNQSPEPESLPDLPDL